MTEAALMVLTATPVVTAMVCASAAMIFSRQTTSAICGQPRDKVVGPRHISLLARSRPYVLDSGGKLLAKGGEGPASGGVFDEFPQAGFILDGPQFKLRAFSRASTVRAQGIMIRTSLLPGSVQQAVAREQ
jgi:hypothetical protein